MLQLPRPAVFSPSRTLKPETMGMRRASPDEFRTSGERGEDESRFDPRGDPDRARRRHLRHARLVPPSRMGRRVSSPEIVATPEPSPPRAEAVRPPPRGRVTSAIRIAIRIADAAAGHRSTRSRAFVGDVAAVGGGRSGGPGRGRVPGGSTSRRPPGVQEASACQLTATLKDPRTGKLLDSVKAKRTTAGYRVELASRHRDLCRGNAGLTIEDGATRSTTLHDRGLSSQKARPSSRSTAAPGSVSRQGAEARAVGVVAAHFGLGVQASP